MFKRFALITNGVVTNIVEQTDTPPLEFNPVESMTAAIGWTYDGVSFTDTTPIPVPLSGNVLVLSQIATLEASITPRRQREALLTTAGKTWLADVDTQIVSLRLTLI